MSTDHQSAGSLSVDVVAVLATLAGLSIAQERLPAVAEQLNAARSAADRLLTIPDDDVTGVAGTFDPAWPRQKRGAS